jgi:hypothetical protein
MSTYNGVLIGFSFTSVVGVGFPVAALVGSSYDELLVVVKLLVGYDYSRK